MSNFAIVACVPWFIETESSVPLHAGGAVTRGYNSTVIGNDQIGIPVLFEDAHASISTDGAPDALAGGFVQKDQVGTERAHASAVVEQKSLEQAKCCPALVLFLSVLRPIRDHRHHLRI
jgi:hypothetical protein